MISTIAMPRASKNKYAMESAYAEAGHAIYKGGNKDVNGAA